MRGAIAGRCEAQSLVGARRYRLSVRGCRLVGATLFSGWCETLFGGSDTKHGFEEPRSLAHGATAWLHELVGAKDEVAVLAPRGDHLDVMATRARGTKGMLKIGLDVAAGRAQLSRQRRNRARFLRQQFKQMSSKRHPSLSACEAAAGRCGVLSLVGARRIRWSVRRALRVGAKRFRTSVRIVDIAKIAAPGSLLM